MTVYMRRDYIKWYSPSLHRDMELLAFGDRGFPVVVFPTSGGRFFEYEDRGMVNALAPKIDRGELQVICVDSVDQESWYNRWATSGRPAASPERLRRLPGAGARALRPQTAPVGRRWALPAAVSADTTPSTSRCAIPTSSPTR